MNNNYYIVENEQVGAYTVCASTELVEYINAGYKPLSFHETYAEAISQIYL
jgi:hypothetical protein